MSEPFLFQVDLRFDIRTMEIVPMSEASYHFLAISAVHRRASAVLEEMRLENPRCARDPDPREPPPPAGTMTPSLVAAKLQAALREAYPEEEIIFWAKGRSPYHAALKDGPKLETENLTIEARPAGVACEVHDLPTAGLAGELLRRAKENTAAGVNACGGCIARARVDALAKKLRAP